MSEEHSNPPTPPTPRFQFSLRGLIGLSVACCLFFSSVAWAWSVGTAWVWMVGAVLFACVSGGLFLVGVYRKRAGLAVSGALLWIVAAFAWPALTPTRESGTGWRKVPITVTIIDADTKAPIAGATVRAGSAGPYVYSASPPPGVETRTDGTAPITFQIEHHHQSVHTPLRGTEKHSWFVFASSHILVEALGYEDAYVTLSELLGADSWREDRLPLPAVTIEMHEMYPE